MRSEKLTSRAWRLLPALFLPRCFSKASSPGVQIACLRDVRGLIQLSGTGVFHFLQGLVTNDVFALEPPGAPPLYTCLLNAQGRSLHEMLLFRTSGEPAVGPDPEPKLFVDVDQQGKEDLLKLLKRYRLRQKIGIEDVSDQHSVWVKFGSPAAFHPTGPWVKDPRLPQLGLRCILPNEGGEHVSRIHGDESGTSDAAAHTSDWLQYRRWRMQHGVAEGEAEIPSGDVIPLEFNLDGLNGISFNKGCYVGQELMARTHFKGVVRKRVMPFKLQQAVSGIQRGDDLYDQDVKGTFRSIGKIQVVDGDMGLAIVRLAKAMPGIESERPFHVHCGQTDDTYVAAQLWRPEWWPPQWGREEQ